MRAEAEGESSSGAAAGTEVENPESEAARKKAEADRLRAAEKFMMIGTGEATCKGCGYEYSPRKGDPEYPVSPGTQFQKLPDDWQCPTCGADKKLFESKQRQVAGFAENQGCAAAGRASWPSHVVLLRSCAGPLRVLQQVHMPAVLHAGPDVAAPSSPCISSMRRGQAPDTQNVCALQPPAATAWAPTA